MGEESKKNQTFYNVFELKGLPLKQVDIITGQYI